MGKAKGGQCAHGVLDEGLNSVDLLFCKRDAHNEMGEGQNLRVGREGTGRY